MSAHPVNDEQLLAYAWGEVNGPEADAVAAHVATCPACAAAISRATLVRDTLRADAELGPSVTALARVLSLMPERPAEPPGRSLVSRLIAALTFDSRADYALAGLRGPGDAYLLGFTAGGTTVDVQVEPPEGGGGRAWQLTGQVDTAERTGPIRVVALDRLGLTAQEVHSDEHGVFLLDLPPGRYDIELTFAQVDLLLSGIDIP